MADTRDQLRAKIMSGTSKRKRVPATLFGAEIEIVQPRVGFILDMKAEDTAAPLRMIIEHCVVPGTLEKVLEEADIESLRDMPFNDEFQNITTILGQMSSVNVKDVEKN